MVIERQQGGTSLIDVLDRVLDKGIVIDAWVRVSLVGIDLITVEARVVVASIDTYLTARPSGGPDDDDDGGNTPPTPSSGAPRGPSGGAPSFAGHAEITPRKPPPRHRRPID
jgi:hypothetical protein